MSKPDAIERTKEALQSVLDNDEAEKVWSMYALDNSVKRQLNMLNLASDLRFHIPIIVTNDSLTKSANIKVSRYHIHQVSLAYLS